MKALIDADILQWEFGEAKDDEGRLLPWPLVQSRIQGRINAICEAVGADDYQLYLTSDDKSNFRYGLATIKEYKGNRKDVEKPRYYQQIRNFLVDHRGAIEVFEQEADDDLGIEQYKDYCKALLKEQQQPVENGLVNWEDHKYLCETVTCSRDKDLNMIPGWHYTWGAGNQKEKQLWWQDELQAIRCFYKQILTGDTVDNIPGLFGVGKSSKLVQHIDTCTTDVDMYDFVLSEYKKRFGSYAEKFLLENARLLWIRREENEQWCPPKRPGKTDSEEESNQEKSEEGC